MHIQNISSQCLFITFHSALSFTNALLNVTVRFHYQTLLFRGASKQCRFTTSPCITFTQLIYFVPPHNFSKQRLSVSSQFHCITQLHLTLPRLDISALFLRSSFPSNSMTPLSCASPILNVTSPIYSVAVPFFTTPRPNLS